MGSRGPVPKRSSARIRTNKESRPDKVPPSKPRAIPGPSPTWHRHARAWYVALKHSVSAKYFEPSDWAFAVCLADIYTEGLLKSNAAMIGQFLAGSARLLTTEADRRRNRVEIGWPGGPIQPEAPESDEHELPAPKLVVSNAG